MCGKEKLNSKSKAYLFVFFQIYNRLCNHQQDEHVSMVTGGAVCRRSNG